MKKVTLMNYKDEGVIWIAFGYEYLIMAAHSAKTLKDFSTDVKTAIVTNVPIENIKYKNIDLFTYVEYINAPAGENRKWKLSMNLVTPFLKTIFLDCDTEVCEKIEPLFEVLEYNPIALKCNNYPTARPVEIFGKDNIYYGLSHWNSGVIAFNKAESKIEVFFQTWRDNYHRLNEKGDQFSLMKTVYESQDINPLPLSVVWNARDPITDEELLLKNFPGKMRIYHYREPFGCPIISKNILSTYNNLEVRFSATIAIKKKEFYIMQADKMFNPSNLSFKEDVSTVDMPQHKMKINYLNVKGIIKKILNHFGYDIRKINK